jgi:hypothetical protein
MGNPKEEVLKKFFIISNSSNLLKLEICEVIISLGKVK